MSRIDELNDQARKTIGKIETHLDAYSASMASTTNIGITLGTALAGGLAVLAKSILPSHPGLLVQALLGVAVLTLLASLVSGVLAMDSRSRISKKAVGMWGLSKRWAISTVAMGGGDEQATAVAFLDSFETNATQMQEAASAYQSEFDRMARFVVLQTGLLILSVAVALVVAFTAYSGVDTATTVRIESASTIPVSVHGSVAVSSTVGSTQVTGGVEATSR